MPQNKDLRNWGKRLDAGDTEDPLLVLAARLREEHTPMPPPSSQFKAKLRAQLIEHHPQVQRRKSNIPRHQSYPIAMPALFLMVILVIVLFMTPLPSKAAEFLSGLFSQAPSDTHLYETPIMLDLSPTPALDLVVTPPTSIADVQAQAGYHVQVPTWLPEGYVFQDAQFDSKHSNSTWQTYMNANHVNGFVLMQTPIEFAESLEIGASADVITVHVNDDTGEYVEGSWVGVVESIDDTPALAGGVWDPDYPFQRLRWTDSEMAYQLSSIGGSPKELTLDQWIAIAESLQ